MNIDQVAFIIRWISTDLLGLFLVLLFITTAMFVFKFFNGNYSKTYLYFLNTSLISFILGFGVWGLWAIYTRSSNFDYELIKNQGVYLPNWLAYTICLFSLSIIFYSVIKFIKDFTIDKRFYLLYTALVSSIFLGCIVYSYTICHGCYMPPDAPITILNS